GRYAKFGQRSPVLPTGVETARLHAVADDDDLRGAVAIANQPVPNRIGIDENAVSELAGVALRAFLHGPEIRSAVANRRDHHGRSSDSSGWNGEHVAVKAVRVHDVDSASEDMPRQLCLLTNGCQ